jgi:hypothetical protein
MWLIRHNHEIRGERTVSTEDNKRVVANFVEVCENQHDLAAADNIFHPEFVNHYAPEGRPIPTTGHPAGSFHSLNRHRSVSRHHVWAAHTPMGC